MGAMWEKIEPGIRGPLGADPDVGDRASSTMSNRMYREWPITDCLMVLNLVKSKTDRAYLIKCAEHRDQLTRRRSFMGSKQAGSLLTSRRLRAL